jgi:hypothetical protein
LATRKLKICVFSFCIAAVGFIHILSGSWMCIGGSILCQLYRSRLDATRHGWRSRRRGVVLERTSWELSTPGGSIL